MRNKNSHFVGASFGGHRFVCFLSAVLLTLVSILAGSLILTVENAAAVIDAEIYHLDMTTANYVNINLLPGPNGSIAIGASEINVTSTTPGGFGLYLSGSDTLYRNGDTTNTDADKKIISTTGTYALPISLISNSTTPATWGYAIAGVGNFDASYDATNPSMDAKFAAVPATNSGQLIKTENSTVSNDTTTIYYGINANTNLTSGEYISGAVSYYSVADISSLIGGELTVSPAFITPNQENTITITTSLSTEMDLGAIEVAVGNYSCVLQTITSTTPLTISCTLPSTLPQGHYNVEVNVSRFGRNYSADNSLHNLYAMQNISEEFVRSMTIDEQYQMYDLRDNKIYFVSRLQDGNVWMTQNLDFEVPSTGVTFSPETTNIQAEKTITPTATWGTDFNGYYYQDGGEYYIAPSETNSDNDTIQSLDGLALDAEERHYSVGSYYSYALASVGETVPLSNNSYGYLSNYICPKGWIIPNNYSNYRLSTGVLLGKYGLLRDGSYYLGDDDEELRESPLYYVRSGYYDGTIQNLGISGHFWSRYYDYYTTSGGGNATTYSRTADHLAFSATSLSTYYYQSFTFGKMYNGFSVRCVALTPNRYTLHYDANGGEYSSNDPTYYDGLASSWGEGTSGSVMITAKAVATKVGHTLLGYADTPDATEPQYHALDILDINQDKTVYAVWGLEPIYQALHDAGVQMTENDYYRMQDMTDEICASIPMPATQYAEITSRLVDERDGKLYFVSKLFDGNCWMTQNLDFELSTEGTTLYPETSAVIAEKTLYAVESGSGADNIAYVDGGDKGPAYGSTVINETNFRKASSAWHYHIGSYYNYAAATAGSGIGTIGVSAIESVCPKGWRLPTGTNYTDNKSYGYLTDTYGLTEGANGGTSSAGSIRYNPLYFQLGGIANDDGSASYYNSWGYYWTASAYSAPHAFYMSFTSSGIQARHSNERYVRANVRCVNGTTKQFTVHYDANGGDSAPADTIKYELTDNTTANVTITSEVPTYGENTFLGWATTADAIVPEYKAGNTFTASFEQTLYAVWDQFDVAYSNAGKTKDASGYFSMQDMTPEICAAVPTPTTTDYTPTTILVDIRDNNYYFVSKLMDGKCWMTQNLFYRLDANATQNRSLSPLTTDTRLPKQLKMTETWTDPYQNSEWFRTGYIENGNGTHKTNALATTDEQKHYFDGTIYSFSAASAGMTEAEVNEGATTDSLCPRGWRLPKGGTNGIDGSQENSEYGTLLNYYGVIHNRELEEGESLTHTLSPLYFGQNGLMIARQFINVSGEAYYWQNGVGVVADPDGEGGTVDNIYGAALHVSNEDTTLGKYIAKNGGYVRCVASSDTPVVVTFTPDDDITGEFIGNDIAVDMAVVPVGTTYTISEDTITFSNGAVVKAQGKYRYGYSNTFASWDTEETTGTITEDTNFLAHFNARLLFRGITTMQEMTPEICEEAYENDSIRPFDTRDNERYWITKLADGRCWMTEDLDFAIASAESGGTTLYPETSNVIEERNVGYTTTANGLDGYRRESYYDENNNLVVQINNNNGVGYSSYNGTNTAFDSLQWHYRLGAFYGFNIATAGTGGSLTHNSGINVTESICPKGWHLPTANSGTMEYDLLRGSYDWGASPDNYAYKAPTYFYRNGYMANGNVTDRGNYGQRWTANIDYNHYTNNSMRINKNTASAYTWNMGVRCIADAAESTGD